jgi:hypothetical protein
MRVIAIQSLDDGVANVYGEGELIENQIPDAPPFSDSKGENPCIKFDNGKYVPCIKLDNGKYVWGFECWWDELETFNTAYKEEIKETIVIEPLNIQPLKL